MPNNPNPTGDKPVVTQRAHIAEPARHIIERIADAVFTMLRECGTATELGNEIAKECQPLFEQLGVTLCSDRWGFDEDEFPHDDIDVAFNMRWNADIRAAGMWRAAHPGNDLVLPDHADLVVWLLDELARHREQETLSREGREADKYRRTLSDPQRLLWRDDVEGICPTPGACWEYGETARCGPCAIKQAEKLGVESNMSVPNLPEVYRLRRELATLSPPASEGREDREKYGRGGAEVARPKEGAERCSQVAPDCISGVGADTSQVRILPPANPPVAWMYRTDLGGQAYFSEKRNDLLAANAPPDGEWVETPLYVSPPASEGRDVGREAAFLPMAEWDKRDEAVLLLVDYDEGDHPLEDDRIAITIGHNNDHNVGEGEGQGWQFAGWCWSHDHYVEGKGTPVGWMPLPHHLARTALAGEG